MRCVIDKYEKNLIKRIGEQIEKRGGVQDRLKHSSIYVIVVSIEGDQIDGVEKKRKKKRKLPNKGRPECKLPKDTLCSGKNTSQSSNYES